tara:strand:+ start:547 stop:747 length:201 start_codon:yes stop_codon:yes gene_type:complete
MNSIAKCVDRKGDTIHFEEEGGVIEVTSRDFDDGDWVGITLHLSDLVFIRDSITKYLDSGANNGNY